MKVSDTSTDVRKLKGTKVKCRATPLEDHKGRVRHLLRVRMWKGLRVVCRMGVPTDPTGCNRRYSRSGSCAVGERQWFQLIGTIVASNIVVNR